MSDDPAPGRGSGDDALREALVSSEVVRRGRLLEFRVDTVELSDGTRSSRDIVVHPGGVCVVAIDREEQVLLVRQWRHAIGRTLLEIPAGTLDREATGAIEDHAGAAVRELAEETGSVAGTWGYLGAFYTTPGFTSELMHLYLATDLAPASDHHGPDEDERLELVRLPFADAVAMVERGEIDDAKSQVGLLRVARLRTSKDRR